MRETPVKPTSKKKAAPKAGKTVKAVPAVPAEKGQDQPDLETAPLHKRGRASRVLRWSTGRVAFLLVVGVVIAVGGACTTYAFAYSGRVLPRTIVAGVPIGGLTRSEAEARLAKHDEDFLSKPLTITYAEQAWQLTPQDLGTTLSHTTALEQAYARGKQGTFWEQLGQTLTAPFRTTLWDVELDVATSGRSETAQAYVASIETAAKETGIDFTPNHVQIVPGTPGKKLDTTSLEQRLYDVHRQGGSEVALLLSEFQPEVTPAQAEPARQQAEQILAAGWTLRAADVSLAVEPKTVASWLLTEVHRDATGVADGLELVIKDDELATTVSTLAGRINREPINARLQAQNGTVAVIADEKDGLKVDEEATRKAVRQAVLANTIEDGRSITAKTAVARADIRRDNIAELGIKEVIGSATTDFAGSPTNRKFNIGLGQRSLNGLIIRDGDTFSTIKSLGLIDESTGYLPELVILNDRTTPQAGGGLCQVSTTLFRAALNAGLPIMARQNHAYRVGYYERGVGPGLDATIYQNPDVDLKIKNDTGHPIFMQSFISGTKITFELYGTKDGRVATISGPQILQEYPVGDPIYTETDTLLKGQVKQTETAHSGAKTTATYIVTRDGQELHRKTFNSYYKPWPARYLVGTKEPAAPLVE